ncbi:MAG: beta-mannosidase [Herbinix sp.]|nr:beta-mannosidase [Herbinix sp.]
MVIFTLSLISMLIIGLSLFLQRNQSGLELSFATSNGAITENNDGLDFSRTLISPSVYSDNTNYADANNAVNGSNSNDWFCIDNTNNSNNESDHTETLMINSPNRFNLDNGWKLARVPDINLNGAELSDPSTHIQANWIDAIVPGTALTSYESAGMIPDPYYGRNMLDISQDEYNVDYWYRNTFTFPSEMKGNHLWINFDGINWKAEIYINGSYLGRIDGPFIRGKFDITSYIQFDKVNCIAVKIIWCQAKEVDTPTFICVNSWDFMPPIPGRNVGIYKDVYLSTSKEVAIVDPFLKTDLPLPNTNYADVMVSVDLQNYTKETVIGKIKGVILPGNISFEQPVTLEADHKVTQLLTYTDFPQLRIKNPKLWWPNGMGDANLYTLQLTFETNGVLSDIKTIRFGIREYSYDTSEGDDLKLCVNGYPVMIRGGNWGIPDAMLKWSDDEFDTSVRLHKEMNFNMIRTWHGTSDFDAFYNACDKYGIMVFEDFWLNGVFYPKEPDMFYANAIDKFKRLRNRTCLALWCGENEAIPPKDLDKFLSDTYDELDGTRLYISSSNSSPVHGGISYGIEDPSWYFKVSKGFVTEVGGVTVPVVESLRKMMPEDKLWPIGNEVWDLHDFDFDIGNKQIDRYKASINSRYGLATSIEDFCEKAQLVNLETYRAIFEGFQDKMWNGTSGVLLWMSQAAWPSTIWQTYDYYFEPTGAYYGSKLACEPVHVQWNSYTGNIKVINNTSTEYRNSTVNAKVYNMDGSLKLEKKAEVNISSCSALSCFDLFDTIGDNIAYQKKVTASSSGSDFSPDKITDGDATTRWAAEEQGNQWVEIDLGAQYDIDNIIITWEAAYAKSFHVQVSSDESNWYTVYEKENGSGGIDNINFSSAKARYVRLNCTKPGTMWAYSIYDIIINSSGTTSAGSSDLSKVHFIKLQLNDENGHLLSENIYWRSKESMDYTDLAYLPDVDLVASAKKEILDDNTILTVNVTNTSNTPAVGIRLKAVNKVSGLNILPAFYSDNYITLMPGDHKDITIQYATGSEQSALILEGFNITVKTVDLD